MNRDSQSLLEGDARNDRQNRQGFRKGLDDPMGKMGGSMQYVSDMLQSMLPTPSIVIVEVSGTRTIQMQV
ncbi:MAG: hypothetical protein AAF583_02155 [Pseudomonadota bacterium]